MFDTNGTAAPIMGIALIYVADLNVTSSSSGVQTASPSAPTTSGAEAGAVLGMGRIGVVVYIAWSWVVIMGTVL